MKRPQLKRELENQKASNKDIEKLLGVVETLKATELPVLSEATREKIAAIPGGKSKVPLIMVTSFGSAFAVMLVLVVAAQTALPGSPLYGLKRGTEYIRALIQPSYKEDIVETRKQELETLEKEEAPQLLIDEAATEYEKASGEQRPARDNDTRRTIDDGSERNTDERRNWRDRRDNNERGDRRDSSNERDSRNGDNYQENNWSWR